jgi:hypothetical protein
LRILDVKNVDLSLAGSIRSVPAELPGSTPDDLADTQHLHIRATPKRYMPYRPPRDSGGSIETTFSQHARSHSLSNEVASMHAQLPEQSQNFQLEAGLPKPNEPFASGRLPTQDIRRASLDSARPRETSEHDSASGHRPHNSLEFVHSLPTLSEKTIAQNDPTTFTTDVIAIPRIAKRYRPNPIRIRNKHLSLPAELPHLKSQPSLAEDLAEWMSTSAQSEDAESTEWDAYSVLSSPAVSIVSSPAVTQAVKNNSGNTACHDDDVVAPVQKTDTEDVDTVISRHTSSSSRHNDQLFLARQPCSEVEPRIETNNRDVQAVLRRSGDQGRTVAARTTSSSIIRKPLPTSTSLALISIPDTVSSNESSPRVDVVSITTSSPQDSSQGIPATHKHANNASESSIAVASPHDVRTPSSYVSSKAASIAVDAELSELQQNLLRQSYVEDCDAPFDADLATRRNIEPELDTTIEDNQERGTEKHYAQAHEAKPEEPVESRQDATPEQGVERKPETPSQNERESHELPEYGTSHISRSSSSRSRAGESAPSIPPVVPKPMSAQAKRRAAHQRRMELAFGKT